MKGESGGRLIAPSFDVLGENPGIFRAGKGNDGAREWRLEGVFVAFSQLEIRAQRRNDELQVFGVGQHFRRTPVERGQMGQEFRLRHVVHWRMAIGEMRRVSAGNEEPLRLAAGSSPQKPDELETQ